MMWFTDLLQSLGVAAARQSFDSAAPAAVRDQFMRWMGYLSQNALKNFTSNVIDPDTCESCSEIALGDCIVCGRRCCLAHASISFKAEMVCDECVKSMVGTKDQEKWNRQAEKQRRRAQRATAKPDVKDTDPVVVALRVLKLKPGASWDEVHTQYRLLALKNHPDRAKDKAKAEQRLVAINAAYAVLKRHYEKAA